MEKTTAQAVLHGLLDVFHEVCLENGIPYILWGETARSVALYGCISDGFAQVQAVVRASDCEKLAEALNAYQPERYFCEYWGNNSKLPRLALRLHDKTSTYIRFDHVDPYIGFGMNLEVLPLRKVGSSEEFHKAKMRETVRYHSLLPYASVSPMEELEGECLDGLVDSAASEDADTFFASCLSELEGSVCRVWLPNGKDRVFASSFLSERKLISFEGALRSLFVPEDFDNYMRVTNKRFWKDRPFSKPAYYRNSWVSPSLPYEIAKQSFDQEGFQRETYYENRVKLHEDGEVSSSLFSELDKRRAVFRAVDDEISVESYYDEQKEADIVNAFVDGDWNTLRAEFSLYREAMIRNSNKKFPYYFSLSKPLQIAFIALLEKDGDHYVAIRALHCYEKRFGDEAASELCRLLRCEDVI